MSTLENRSTALLSILVIAALTLFSRPSLATFCPFSDNFDTDTANTFPTASGWTATAGGDTTNTFVKTLGSAPSSPNVFQLEQNGSNPTAASFSFPTVDLDYHADDLRVSMDLNVAQMDPIGSESPGFRLYPYQSSTGDAATGIVRILGSANTTQFQLTSQTPDATPNGVTLNVGQWYHFLMVFHATGNSGGFEDGTVKWYINNNLVITETYHDSLVTRLQGINSFTISQIGNYQSASALSSDWPILDIDNVFVDIPEPASLALLAIGGLAMFRRPRSRVSSR